MSKRINFTPGEKQLLMATVAKYKHIVENKCTKSDFVHKKNKIWEQIVEEFNCSAETGSRSAKQLKILYDNIKRNARKSVADEHHEDYAAKLKAAKTAASADKRELFKTGGGTYGSNLTCQQEQLLAEIREQVRPLENHFDSAAVYFSDEIEMEITEQPVDPILETTIVESIPEPEPEPTPEPEFEPHMKNPIKKNKKKMIRKKLTNCNLIKKQFYLKKLEAAKLEVICKKLEKKKLLLEIKKLQQ